MACDSNDMQYFTLAKRMKSKIISIAICIFVALTLSNSVEFILKPNIPTCTVLISSFDPIKVQAIFPAIGSKQQGQKFKITLKNQKTKQIQQTLYSEDNKQFRNNFALESNIIYSLCFEFTTERSFGPRDVIFVGFTAEEHFEEKINQIQIPKELANEENLKILYEIGSKMDELNANTIKNQKKERELEDKLVDLSLHKGQRIVTITLIQCFVIIVSGVYQIFALRRFLIEKNLY